MKFFTQEMADEAKKAVDADAGIQAKLKKASIRFLLIGTDCPGNEDRQMSVAFEGGKLSEAKVEAKPAPSDFRTAPVDKTKYAAKIMGSYETIGKIASKKLPMMAAMGSMKIDGDMARLVGNIAAMTSLLDTMGALPVEY
jgi:hypothetical protein